MSGDLTSLDFYNRILLPKAPAWPYAAAVQYVLVLTEVKMPEQTGKVNPISLQDREAVENPPGVFRTTLAYNDQTMLCHFRMKAGARIPLHHHPAVQNGYAIQGKIQFFGEDGPSFIAEGGCGYVFGANEPHGAEVLSDAEVIECFSPKRPEYEP
jgi:quercetin dioxygenase-like cupin family protein